MTSRSEFRAMYRQPVIRGRAPGLLPVDEQRRVESLAHELQAALTEEWAVIGGLSVPFDLIQDYTEHVWREARSVPILRPKS